MGEIPKVILVNVVIILTIIVAFDAASYHFLPDEYAARFPAYRHFQPNPRDIAGHARYPKEYFVQNADRGFDIGPNSRGNHWVDGLTYPIWSNSLGCFDREHDETTPYVYLAGDSFTWGYTPYGQKFGTLMEEQTTTNIFKCGVGHTGQYHQYSKLVEIIGTIDRVPQSIIIFYCHNDVVNDYLYPHSTVLNGWLLDRVYLDGDDELVWLSEFELARRLSKRLEKIETQKAPSLLMTWKDAAKHYSMAANIADYVKDSMLETIDGGDTAALKAFYTLPVENGGVFSYSDNLMARKNKEAIHNFKTFAAKHGIQLAMVLIPPKVEADNTHWYEELRAFLDTNEIRYIDLAEAFAARKIDTSKIYWYNDSHFNPAGNELVATIVIESFPDILVASR